MSKYTDWRVFPFDKNRNGSLKSFPLRPYQKAALHAWDSREVPSKDLKVKGRIVDRVLQIDDNSFILYLEPSAVPLGLIFTANGKFRSPSLSTEAMIEYADRLKGLPDPKVPENMAFHDEKNDYNVVLQSFKSTIAYYDSKRNPLGLFAPNDIEESVFYGIKKEVEDDADRVHRAEFNLKGGTRRRRLRSRI